MVGTPSGCSRCWCDRSIGPRSCRVLDGRDDRSTRHRAGGPGRPSSRWAWISTAQPPKAARYQFALAAARARNNRRSNPAARSDRPPPHLEPKEFATRARWLPTSEGSHRPHLQLGGRALLVSLLRSPTTPSRTPSGPSGITARKPRWCRSWRRLTDAHAYPPEHAHRDGPRRHDQVAPPPQRTHYAESLQAPHKQLVGSSSPPTCPTSRSLGGSGSCSHRSGPACPPEHDLALCRAARAHSPPAGPNGGATFARYPVQYPLGKVCCDDGISDQSGQWWSGDQRCPAAWGGGEQRPAHRGRAGRPPAVRPVVLPPPRPLEDLARLWPPMARRRNCVASSMSRRGVAGRGDHRRRAWSCPRSAVLPAAGR